MIKKQWGPLLNIALLMIIFLIVFYILYIWASLIIPFIIAVLFSFAIVGLSHTYKSFNIPPFIAFTMSLATYVLIFWLIWRMIWSNIEELYDKLPFYQDNIIAIISSVFAFFGISEPTSLNSFLQEIDISKVFSLVIDTVTSIFSSAGIILFYVMFILLEYRHFKEKLNLMFTSPTRKKEIFEILEKIKRDIKSYFVIKTTVSFITWFFSYIIMLSFGLDFAIFWAFLVFLLNFIPSIWSVIAVSFPVMLSLVQFDSYYSIIFMWWFLIWIQIMMWNIIEPKFMGNKLNLSPLVIIISLWFWGSIWWIVGMLLAVPIMVIINIILAKIPATKPVAILLSEKWDLQVEWWDDIAEIRKQLFKTFLSKFVKK